MSAQDAKKKDSKPQPSENELLRAAMVSSSADLSGSVAMLCHIVLSACDIWTCATMQERPGVQAGVMERKLFTIPSFKIYGGVAGFFDFGPPGCAVKQNITQLWRQHFILEENMLEV